MSSNDSIILAAVQSAGEVGDDPGAWEQRVKESARTIKIMLRGESEVSRQLTALDKILDPDDKRGKVFRGTVVKVAKEQKSTRGVLTVWTGTDRTFKDFKTGEVLPAGHEQLRTERTDNPDGLAIARLAQALKGHKVTLYVELQEIRGSSDGYKVRVVQHLEDLGIDEEYSSE